MTEPDERRTSEAPPLLPPIAIHCDVASGDHNGCNWSVTNCTDCACECPGCSAWWQEHPRSGEAPLKASFEAGWSAAFSAMQGGPGTVGQAWVAHGWGRERGPT